MYFCEDGTVLISSITRLTSITVLPYGALYVARWMDVRAYHSTVPYTSSSTWVEKMAGAYLDARREAFEVCRVPLVKYTS